MQSNISYLYLIFLYEIVLQINRIEKVNASFKSVLLIQWQKCEIFCNKTSIISHFSQRSANM